MSLLAVQNLGGNIIGGPTDGALLLPVEFESGSQSEVSDLDVHLVADEQVAQLQVPVDDLVGMEVLEGRQDLH